jgi:hypothetical protein
MKESVVYSMQFVGLTAIAVLGIKFLGNAVVLILNKKIEKLKGEIVNGN